MNFGSLLKNITNFQFPYSIDNEPFQMRPLWEVYSGTRKRDSLPVTIFKARRNAQNEELILHSLHMSKIIRIPGLATVLDTFDNGPDNTFIITEKVQPLSLDNGGIGVNGIYLGINDLLKLFEVLSPLFYIGNICIENIYMTETGEWVLFGLECCMDKAPTKFDKYRFQDNVRLWKRVSGIPDPTGEVDPSKIDEMSIGSLMNALFNGVNKPAPRDWQRDIDALGHGKMTLKNFINKIRNSTTWNSNELLPIYEDLKEFNIKDSKDKLMIMKKFESFFFSNDDGSGTIFHELTEGFINKLIVPEICQCIKWILSREETERLDVYNGTLTNFVTMLLSLVVNDSKLDTMTVQVQEIIVTSFKLSDRQIRFLLLIYLPKITKKFPKQLEFGTKIFPFYLQGLIDTDKTLRLQTLKVIPSIIDEITERQFNNEILRYIAKTQVDADEEIRTWTVLIIIRMSNKINNRDSVLSTIYTKSLKDPCVKTKLAAIYGLRESIDIFSVEIIANRIMSVIAPGLLDREKIVRIKAKELFNMYLTKLEKEANNKFSDSSDENNNNNSTTTTREAAQWDKEFNNAVHGPTEGEENDNSTQNDHIARLTANMAKASLQTTTPPPELYTSKTKSTKTTKTTKTNTANTANTATVDEWEPFDDDDDGWDNMEEIVDNDNDEWDEEW